jgi:hypothetical protein
MRLGYPQCEYVRARRPPSFRRPPGCESERQTYLLTTLKRLYKDGTPLYPVRFKIAHCGRHCIKPRPSNRTQTPPNFAFTPLSHQTQPRSALDPTRSHALICRPPLESAGTGRFARRRTDWVVAARPRPAARASASRARVAPCATHLGGGQSWDEAPPAVSSKSSPRGSSSRRPSVMVNVAKKTWWEQVKTGHGRSAQVGCCAARTGAYTSEETGGAVRGTAGRARLIRHHITDVTVCEACNFIHMKVRTSCE